MVAGYFRRRFLGKFLSDWVNKLCLLHNCLLIVASPAEFPWWWVRCDPPNSICVIWLLIGFTSKKYPSECRLEASNFIRLLCHTSVLTLQMFIAWVQGPRSLFNLAITLFSCRGLKVLVDLLDEDYTEQTELVVHALNGIGSVFELQSPTTKNDFCRMFIREGLLDPLSAALLNVMANRDTSAVEMKMKMIQIFLVFSQVSQSDIHVRGALGTRKVIRREFDSDESVIEGWILTSLKA
jgi:hypothetical protein